MKKIRILHVVDNLNAGGIETLLVNLLRNIDKERFHFDFVVHTKEASFYDNEVETLGAKIIRISKFNGMNYNKYCRQFSSLIKSGNYDIVHGHLRSTARIYLRIAKENKCKTILHSHSTSIESTLKGKIKLILQKNAHKYSDLNLACSKEAGQWLFGTEDFKLLNNGISLNKFKFSSDVRKKYRDDLKITSNLVFGYVASFREVKNHLFLLDLFFEYLKINKDAVLILVGDGILKTDIENKIRDLRMEKNVILLGVREDISSLLNLLDIFIFPSKYEGLGISIIEAQCNGLPCVISNSIPTDVDLTDLIFRVKDIENIESWLKEIDGVCFPDDRSVYVTDIKKSGYDLKDSLVKLCEFYTDLERN